MIRESSGTPARVFARFGALFVVIFVWRLRIDPLLQSEYGVEKHVELDGLTAKEVEQRVSDLVKV